MKMKLFDRLISDEDKKLLSALKESFVPTFQRTCPICSYCGYFTHYGRPPRRDALCTSCGSLERNRLFWLWFKGDTEKIQEPILHFAPEKCLNEKLSQLYTNYKTADLYNKADLKIDIESIDLPSEAFSTVICNHVLEHVSDRKALGEIFRILSPGGIFIVSVPIIDGWDKTYEDDSIVDPVLRDMHFGQSDHVRFYGRDFRDRLTEAGFSQIDEHTAYGKDVVEYGLLRGEKFFVCRKN